MKQNIKYAFQSLKIAYQFQQDLYDPIFKTDSYIIINGIFNSIEDEDIVFEISCDLSKVSDCLVDGVSSRLEPEEYEELQKEVFKINEDYDIECLDDEILELLIKKTIKNTRETLESELGLGFDCCWRKE